MNGFDSWTIVFGLCFILFALSLRSIWRSRFHSRKAKILWTAFCVVPLFGPAAWFLTGIQRQRPRR